jgi:hypothetical protein
MARVLKMSRDSIIVASKGSAVILSLITILCCGIIFVGLVWVPFVIKSSKSYLQVFVDELCLRLYQELPFTAAFDQLNLDLNFRDDRSAFSVALNRVRTLINFNGPMAFVGIVPSQAGRGVPNFDGTLAVEHLAFFEVNLENPDNNQWTLLINRPENPPALPDIPQFEEHLQALHPTRSENSVVICFSQGTIERAAWMLPLIGQQPATVSAISGLFQNISNINSSPPLGFGALGNNPLGVNTYPSPLVLFELDQDNSQENFPVCFEEGGTEVCDTNPNLPQQFNVRRVAKKLTAIHLINLLARNGATRHSTRVGIVWQRQDPDMGTVVERVLVKAVGDDVFSISFDPPPGLNFPQPLCSYYNSRKRSLEDLFVPSELVGFGTLDCQPFVQLDELDVLDVIYFSDSDQMGWDNPDQDQGFNIADQLPLSPHIIWIGTDLETFRIFLESVFVDATQGAGNARPVVTAILFPTQDVPFGRLATLLANLNLIDWDPRNNQVKGLTFRAPFFNIFVFDGCGYIDVPNRVTSNDNPPSPYWECLTTGENRLLNNVFQDFLRAFAEGNARPAFPQGIPLAPFVAQGRVTGDTIAERLAVYIYRTFLTSRGWLF